MNIGMLLLESKITRPENQYILLRQAMPVFERTIKKAVESERRLMALHLKETLRLKKQDLFTLAQVERLVTEVIAQRESKTYE